jgi:hypothetical protein
MDGSILQVGLVAVVGAMVLMVYEMGSALRPITCPECSHCRARNEADAREQDRLAREYARRVNLPHRDDDDDDRLIR